MSKEQKLFHSTVTFTGVGSARIDNLTQEQAWQVSDILRLIERQPPRYSANGDLLYCVETSVADSSRAITVEGGFIARLMRRFNNWMMGGCIIVALMLGAREAFAQELRARAVEPIRVSIVQTPEASATDEEFNRRLRAELNKSKTVAFTSQSDYDIATAATEITEKGRVVGYAVASMVVTPEGARRRKFNLSIRTGPSLEELAADLAKKLNTEYFNREK